MNISRRTLIGGVAGAAALASTPMTSHAANGTPALYFAAHADDESLILGPSINAHVYAGREVHCVLATTGGATGVLRSTRLHDDIGHVPTRFELTAMRDQEYLGSLEALGVFPARRHFERLRSEDGALTVKAAKGMWDRALSMFGGRQVDCKTLTYFDPHPDHASLGQALRELVTDGDPRVHSARYSYKRWDSVTKAAMTEAGVRYRVEGRPVTLNQQQPYIVSEPPLTWGVGYRSAGRWFRYMEGVRGGVHN